MGALYWHGSGAGLSTLMDHPQNPPVNSTDVRTGTTTNFQSRAFAHRNAEAELLSPGLTPVVMRASWPSQWYLRIRSGLTILGSSEIVTGDTTVAIEHNFTDPSAPFTMDFMVSDIVDEAHTWIVYANETYAGDPVAPSTNRVQWSVSTRGSLSGDSPYAPAFVFDRPEEAPSTPFPWLGLAPMRPWLGVGPDKFLGPT